jgi:hypothetical protein
MLDVAKTVSKLREIKQHIFDTLRHHSHYDVNADKEYHALYKQLVKERFLDRYPEHFARASVIDFDIEGLSIFEKAVADLSAFAKQHKFNFTIAHLTQDHGAPRAYVLYNADDLKPGVSEKFISILHKFGRETIKPYDY